MPFGYDRQVYEIDLTAEHADEFAADMARWIALARKVKPVKNRAKASSRVTANGADRVVASQRERDQQAEKAEKAERDRIRRWCERNGIDVSPRGVIPQHGVEAYRAAHPGKAAKS